MSTVELPKAPTVSVILPTYQRRELVRRAIASVMAQTYRDFELIVVDDGSTDGTREALASVSEKLRYHWQPNRGVAAARNAGLRMARGSIVAFIDSDDRWLPDHLAAVTEMLARHPQAVLASTSPGHTTGGSARPRDAYLHEPLPTQFFANPVGYLPAVAIRRSALRAAGDFNEGLLVGEGWELWLRLGFQGVFCMLRRGTVIKQHNEGLKHWGRRRGDLLGAYELGLRWAIERLGASNGVGARELTAKAEGALHFATALRALDRKDGHTTGTALREACRLYPELSRQPEMVERRIGHLQRAHEPAEHLRHLATAASLWPDPQSDTALYLRARALLAALLLGRVQQATQLTAAWPLRPTPSFLRRTLPAFARSARGGVDAYVHRGRDRVDLDSALEMRSHQKAHRVDPDAALKDRS
jgi:glycosyl transferase family 2